MDSISEIEIQGNRILLDDELAAQVNKWGHRLKGYIDGNQLVIIPAGETPDAQYPLVSTYTDVADGEPVLAGTRITVRAIVEYDHLYKDIAKTLRALPQISREQVNDALGYYADHTTEIDKYIAANESAYDKGAAQE